MDRKACSKKTSVSIMVLPTKCTRSFANPRAERFSEACRECVNNKAANSSATILFTSSGMVMSPLRSPASTCPYGMSSLANTSAAASVEFTSPGIKARSGRSRRTTDSSAFMTRPVCSACVPDPTLSQWSGSGILSWSRKSCDISGS